MLEALRNLFSEGHFMPHGMCYLWQPGVLWLNVASDALIATAYFSIPFALLYFVRRRKDLEFQWMFLCFAAFIIACGGTHLVDVIVVWHPYYWVAGTIKAFCALVSVPTAILLVELIPQALKLPGPKQWEAANATLRFEIAERQRADQQLRRVNAELESRVIERTKALGLANASQLRQLRQLELLSRITRAIGERQDLLSILQVVILSLEQDLPIDYGCACLLDSATRTLTVARVGAPGAGKSRTPFTQGARMTVDDNGLSRAAAGNLVYEPDIDGSRWPFARKLAEAGLFSLVLAPLTIAGNTFAVLVAAREAADSFSSGDREFLRQLSEHVALAAHQAQLYGDLQRAYDDLRETQLSVMQHERLRALGQMASGVAHDINNALSPAALYAQSLLERESGLSDAAKQNLETIQRAIEDVGHTVERMREFYRPRGAPSAVVPVPVNRVLQQVVELTRARWHDMPQERGIVIDLRTELASELPPLMGSDSDIRDAVTNLILNAVDAMPSGGGLVIRSGAVLRDSAPARQNSDAPVITHIRIEVCDQGVGMDEATRSRCLEPFFTTKGERGTGLGLAMVYGAVERHRGDIQIQSAPGQGTTVSLILPVGSKADGEADAVSAPSHPSRSLRILIVDDDPLLLRSLRDTLQADGHEVVTTEGGQAGIETFEEAERRGQPFAIVLSDLGMPYVDGRRVAAAIKAVSPATPVVLITGWGQRMQVEKDLPLHVDRVLSKPPKLQELRLALAELTSGCCRTI